MLSTQHCTLSQSGCGAQQGNLFLIDVCATSRKYNKRRPKTSDENCQKLFHFFPEAVFELNQKCNLRFYTSVELPLSTLQSRARNTLIFRKLVSRKKYWIICFFGFGTKKCYFQKKCENWCPKKPFAGQKLSHEKNYLIIFGCFANSKNHKNIPKKNPTPGRVEGGQPGGFGSGGGGCRGGCTNLMLPCEPLCPSLWLNMWCLSQPLLGTSCSTLLALRHHHRKGMPIHWVERQRAASG